MGDSKLDVGAVVRIVLSCVNGVCTICGIRVKSL